MSKTNIEDNVLIFPNILHFQEDRNQQFQSDYIVISSAWLKGIAYQINNYDINLFLIQSIEGFIPPCESKKIPVVFLSNNYNINKRNFNCNFNVNISEINDKDLQENNPQLYWRFHQKNFSKTLPCEVIFRELNSNNFSDNLSDNNVDMNTNMNNNTPQTNQIEDKSSIALPTGHILDLMIKNVSKDTKLTPQEFEELKSIRTFMTKDQWNIWLSYARDEKKKRLSSINQFSNQRLVEPKMSIKDESEFINATNVAVQTAFQYQTNDTIKNVESSRYQIPLQQNNFSNRDYRPSFSETIPDTGSSRPRGHAKISSIPSSTPLNSSTSFTTTNNNNNNNNNNNSNSNNNSNIVNTPFISPYNNQIQKSEYLQPTSVISFPLSSLSIRNSQSNQQTTIIPTTTSTTTAMTSTNIQRNLTHGPVLGEPSIPKRSTVPSPPSFVYTETKKVSSPTAYAHVVPSIPKQLSPEQLRTIIPEQTTYKVNHRISAPAERMSEPGKNILSMFNDQTKPKPSPSIYQPISRSTSLYNDNVENFDKKSLSPPQYNHFDTNESYNPNITIDRFSGTSNSTPYRESKQSKSIPIPISISQPSTQNQNIYNSINNNTSNNSQNNNNSYNNNSFYPSNTSNLMNNNFNTNLNTNTNTNTNPTPNIILNSNINNNKVNGNSDNTSDNIKSNALRIDSAYAAAQSLKASTEADLAAGLISHEKASSTLAMVNAMLSSLEKSKNSLNHLAQDIRPIKKSSPADTKHIDKLKNDLIKQTMIATRNNSNTLLLGSNNGNGIIDGNRKEIQDNNEIENNDGFDKRFDDQSNDDDIEFESFFPKKSLNQTRDLLHSTQNQGNKSKKWNGESIGYNPYNDHDGNDYNNNDNNNDNDDNYNNDYEQEISSEISMIEASDWPPPPSSTTTSNNQRKSINGNNNQPKRGFISASERLKPQSTTPIPIASQRSVSASRLDSKKGQKIRPKTPINDRFDKTTSQYSYNDDINNSNHNDNDNNSINDFSTFSTTRKKNFNQSNISLDTRHTPHYFLQSRHENKSLKSPLYQGNNSSSIVSKKSIHTVRMAKGMPRVVRLCVSHGPLIKTYDDNPLRIDVENCTLDVVWREKHIYGPEKKILRQEKFGIQTASTLRRERFSFDDVFSGPDATSRLLSYTKRRIKTSLLNTRGIVFLCLAGGDFGTNPTAYLEPPMSVILGDSGGHGLISSILEEIFKYKLKHPQINPVPISTPHRLYTGSNTPPIKQIQVVNDTVATLSNDYVLFSAIIICEGQIIDLLSTSSSSSSKSLSSSFTSSSSSKVPKIIKKSNDMYSLTHVTRLQLRSIADFERIAGVLLGRRATLRELTNVLFNFNIQSSSISLNDISLPDMPWLLSSEHEACILFSLTTTGEGISMSSHGQVNYYFVSPCGKYWSLPGSEICLLAEAISGLPHTPPPSLYQAGEITKLLVDSNAPDMDYVTIASVGNQRKDGSKVSLEEDEEMIQNALQSFRVVSQLSSIT